MEVLLPAAELSGEEKKGVGKKKNQTHELSIYINIHQIHCTSPEISAVTQAGLERAFLFF